MKILILVLTLFISVSTLAQIKDTRAELAIRGIPNEMKVTPNGKIWLTTSYGNSYYSNHIDSNWHYGCHSNLDVKLKNKENYGSLGLGSILERASFFNRDTAIITGYIYGAGERKTNGYYRTTDGGKTWLPKTFDGDSWMYTAATRPSGHAWFGGLNKKIFHTNDYGVSLKGIEIPLKKSDRIYEICMQTDLHGVLGSDANEILITYNNWKTSKNISTPSDQKKFSNSSLNETYRINRLALWKNYIVVTQNDHTFYTDTAHIDWRKFPIAIYDYVTNSTNQELYAVTKELKAVRYTTPSQYTYLSEEKIDASPITITIADNSMFIMDRWHNVYKINSRQFIKRSLYTYDKPIPTPDVVRNAGNLYWGKKNKFIYVSEHKDKEWYRENKLDFNIVNLNPISDSIAIIWDGDQNYLYSLADHKLSPHKLDQPIKELLSNKITTLKIKAGSRGCFHGYADEITYTLKGDTYQSAETSMHKRLGGSEKIKFNRIIQKQQLMNVVNELNTNPDKVSALQEFNISKNDLKNYKSMVAKWRTSNYHRSIHGKKIDKKFYYAIVDRLDTISTQTLRMILGRDENMHSTTSNSFEVLFINEAKDSLRGFQYYYVDATPYHLPLRFKYKNQYFNSYNVNLARLIGYALPEKFKDKRVFDNKYLIKAIADYYYYLETE